MTLGGRSGLISGLMLLLSGCGANRWRKLDAGAPDGPLPPFQQVEYIKASNTDSHDVFGSSVAVSQDGSVIISGAEGESSAFRGVNADQQDNSATSSGAAYVFQSEATTWGQQAYLKSDVTRAGQELGKSVAISSDGMTVVLGAVGDCNPTTGVDPATDSGCAATLSGAVFVFTWSGNMWVQQAYIKSSNAEAGDEFGRAVALSADGSTLAVSATEEASSAMGVGGNQLDNSAPGGGAVYVFSRLGETWKQEAYIKASNTVAGLNFGYSVALSRDSSTLAVGTPIDDSAATGVNGNEADHSAPFSGAVYVFVRAGGSWAQQAYLKASNTGMGDGFGGSVAMSDDGGTLVVGAPWEQSHASGVDGNQDDNSTDGAGAVYVFSRTNSTWKQETYIKASNPLANAFFGWSTSLSSAGTSLLVGAYGEQNWTTGVDSEQTDNVAPRSGAAYLYTLGAANWHGSAYIKASNTDDGDEFGWSVSVVGDGHLFAIGAPGESSSATGIDGAQDDNRDPNSGAVYVFSATPPQ